MNKKNVLVVLTMLFTQLLFAQDATRYAGQVKEILENHPHAQNQGVVLFTGSSSVRLWKDLPSDFPKHKIVNAGFGGSQASDLLHYLEELVLGYNPQKIFIYEGDNDISAGKSTTEIIGDLSQIVSRIREKFAKTEIVLISAKPSVARWELAPKYQELNDAMKKYAKSEKKVSYADVWAPMIGTDGKPLPDIFVEDNLHMNKKGYDIWAKVMQKHLR